MIPTEKQIDDIWFKVIFALMEKKKTSELMKYNPTVEHKFWIAKSIEEWEKLKLRDENMAIQARKIGR